MAKKSTEIEARSKFFAIDLLYDIFLTPQASVSPFIQWGLDQMIANILLAI